MALLFSCNAWRWLMNDLPHSCWSLAWEVESGLQPRMTCQQAEALDFYIKILATHSWLYSTLCIFMSRLQTSLLNNHSIYAFLNDSLPLILFFWFLCGISVCIYRQYFTYSYMDSLDNWELDWFLLKKFLKEYIPFTDSAAHVKASKL